VKYLQEHVDTVLRAVRNSDDLTRGSASWETTAWARSMSDAVKLTQMLQDTLFEEVDRLQAASETTVGLVRSRGHEGPAGPEVRWGVLVRLGRTAALMAQGKNSD
jgi:hypothetical protein